jgi:lipoate-protein ligase B
LRFLSLIGSVPYAEASRLQQQLVDRRARGEIPDTLMFLEHEPVVTRGRGLQWTGVERPRAMPMGPLPPGIAFAESERGGDLTYHGPGQLVIYPIVKLDGSTAFAPARDVSAFLRGFEQAVIDDLKELGLPAESREGATGIWLGERKLASLGIAVRKWVVWHGMAVNVVNDLRPFHLIAPWGFAPEVMTRLADLLPQELALRGEGWRAWYEARLARAVARAAGIEAEPALEHVNWRVIS